MHLHIGGGDYVPLEHLVCMVDALHMGEDTKRFIRERASHGEVRPCEGKPKTYLITGDGTGKQTVYASAIGTRALHKRWAEACLHDNIRKIAHLTVEEDN